MSSEQHLIQRLKEITSTYSNEVEKISASDLEPDVRAMVSELRKRAINEIIQLIKRL